MLVVVADRGGVWAAERTVADQVAAELASYEVDNAPPGEERNLVVLVDSHSEETAWAAATRLVYEDSRGRRYQQETLTMIIVTHAGCDIALQETPPHFGEEDGD